MVIEIKVVEIGTEWTLDVTIQHKNGTVEYLATRLRFKTKEEAELACDAHYKALCAGVMN